MFETAVTYHGETVQLQFEHSLFSMSKWEAKHRKVFMSRIPHKPELMIAYFQCMLLTPDVDPNIVYVLGPQQMVDLKTYIDTPQTIETVPDEGSSGVKETVTSLLIYHWMTSMKINWEAQHWHLSRLIMLVRIQGFKMQPEKKRDTKALEADWAAANERQKAFFKTKG